MPPSEHRLPSTVHRQLVAYFRSGWAFLIPYLAAYLLYAWLDLPVNPAGAGSIENGAGRWIPCLLHVYWLFHALHLVLGAFALRSWLRQSSLLPSPFSLLPKAAPWFFLMLLFWIPGIYLEFPADPWQHYARTNEWSWHELVTEHSTWKKSSYFLAYSFIGKISPPLLQLKWFDVYYTACCLLLCWQYYRLARAIGFSERTSMIFVLLNVLLFGNNIFGFYRYYGMSSTVFAQLGAVAMTRIAIEMARGRLKAGGRRPENSDPSESPSVVLSWFARLSRSDPEPVERAVSHLSHSDPEPVEWARTFLQQGAIAVALVALTAFNHIQGLGIAAIGITAVVVWRLIEWRRSMIGWLALLAVGLSVAAVLWYPRHPLLDSVYVPQGWMTSWYGFNFFQPSSAGFQRAWLIPGLLGAINIMCGLFLLRRNSLVGWLTILPVFVPMLPCVAIPFANSLAAAINWDGGYIIAFHRLLFAIPSGLAGCALFLKWENGTGRKEKGVNNGPQHSVFSSALPTPRLAFPAILVALAAFAAMPTGAPGYNRLFNVFIIPPDDLAMKHAVKAFTKLKQDGPGAPKLSTSQSYSYVASAIGIENTWYPIKLMVHAPSNTVQWSAWEFRESGKRKQPALGFVPSARKLFSPESPSALLSGHWNSRQVDLQTISGPAIDLSLKVASPKIDSADRGGTWYRLP